MSLIQTNDKSFVLQADESLLEALERTGHEVEFQCRSGYCGSCRLKLLSGQVDYAEPPLAFVGPNEVLPCCCRVLTDIHIECHARDDAQTRQSDLFVPDLFEPE